MMHVSIMLTTRGSFCLGSRARKGDVHAARVSRDAGRGVQRRPQWVGSLVTKCRLALGEGARGVGARVRAQARVDPRVAAARAAQNGLNDERVEHGSAGALGGAAVGFGFEGHAWSRGGHLRAHDRPVARSSEARTTDRPVASSVSLAAGAAPVPLPRGCGASRARG